VRIYGMASNASIAGVIEMGNVVTHEINASEPGSLLATYSSPSFAQHTLTIGIVRIEGSFALERVEFDAGTQRYVQHFSNRMGC